MHRPSGAARVFRFGLTQLYDFALQLAGGGLQAQSVAAQQAAQEIPQG